MKRILERSFYALLCCMMFCAFTCGETQIQDIISTTSNDVDLDDMVLIPAGEVTIGAPRSAFSDIFFEMRIIFEQQTVFMDAFYIDTYEVTVAEYKRFVEATGYDGSWGHARQEPDHPVYAPYAAAVAYAEWAGKRLPTSAEWEKAARGGLVGKLYPWGNEPPNDDLARHQSDHYRRGVFNSSVPVGSYPPNGYGLYDMAGNAAEWVQHDLEITWNTPTHGGSWLSGNSWFCRVYVRELLPPVRHFNTVGFRCVVDTF